MNASHLWVHWPDHRARSGSKLCSLSLINLPSIDFVGGDSKSAAAVSPWNAQRAIYGLSPSFCWIEVIPLLELIFLHILLVDIIISLSFFFFLSQKRLSFPDNTMFSSSLSVIWIYPQWVIFSSYLIILKINLETFELMVFRRIFSIKNQLKETYAIVLSTVHKCVPRYRIRFT